MNFTKQQVIKWFKQNSPEEASDCKEYGFKMNRVGSGAFREVYVINKDDAENRIVAKFPIPTEGLYHSQLEIRNINRVNRCKKYSTLRPFMPVMHYSNMKTGVILMDYYAHLSYGKAALAADILLEVRNVIIPTKYNDSSDIEYYNIRQDAEGTVKLIDVGML